jgi:hypothetical protein
MDIVKKILGVVWMIGAVGAEYLMASKTWSVFTQANVTQDVYLPWVIILIVFTPVAGALCLFGFYGLTGEYTNIVIET